MIKLCHKIKEVIFMPSRKEIKKNAKNNIKHNYFRNVIIMFICTILLSNGINLTSKNILDLNNINKNIPEIIINKEKLSNSEIIDELLNKGPIEKEKEEERNNKYYDGILSIFFNEITSTGSITFGILNGINKMLFEEKLQVGVLIIISNIILLIITTIFIKVIEINKCRYFLEQRRYLNTKIDKILFSYKINKTFHLSYILFIKTIKELLWSLTIIGGFIKYYEYKMIPYILAENPTLSKNEAFALSKSLTDGNKLSLFKMDLSLLGWEILNLFTFNLSGIFFSNIYCESIYAEIYMHLRNKENNPLLNDELLNIPNKINDIYPEDKFSIKIDKTKKWFKIDYNRNYTIENYIMFYFTFSLIGWLWEMFYTLINNGIIVNRGFMHGPWIPIYGTGGLLILILLKKVREKPFVLFISSFTLCGIVEYFTAWYLETFRKVRYWNYDGYFLNLHGRICLEGLLLFGIGGCAFVYVLAPLLDNVYQKIKPKIKRIICIILVVSFTFDLIYSLIYPNTGDYISSEYRPK